MNDPTRRDVITVFGAAAVPALAAGMTVQEQRDFNRRQMAIEQVLRELWGESFGDRPFPEIISQVRAK